MTQLKTLLLGFGRIAQGYKNDSVMASKLAWRAHAQVLTEHPAFCLAAVVDPSQEALDKAKHEWGIKNIATTINALDNCQDIDVIVMASPPENRLEAINQLPNLKAILVEKPLGNDSCSAQAFAEACKLRNLIVQVNLLRRADEKTRQLAEGLLHEYIGKVQTVFGIYGNGLLNNGTHVIDLIHMLISEVEAVQAIAGAPQYQEGPIKGDVNLPFVMHLRNGLIASIHPVQFTCFRENGLDIWGCRGRLQYLHGGLTILRYPVRANRMIAGELEVAVDEPTRIDSTLGQALYHIYSNLAETISGRAKLLSPLEPALQSARIIDAVLISAKTGGQTIKIKDLVDYKDLPT